MRVLAYISFSFAAACALFVYARLQSAALAIAAGAMVAAVVLLYLRKGRLKRIGLIALGISLGFAWCSLYWAVVCQPAYETAGTEQVITAVACDSSRSTSYGQSVTVRVQFADRSVKALLYLDAQAPALEPGDRITVQARLRLSSDDADTADTVYYNAQGVFLTAVQTGECAVEHTERPALRYLPARLLSKIKVRIGSLFEEDTAPFMTALLTGDKSLLSDSEEAAIRAAGLSHVVAVSGMHLSCLLGFLLFGLNGRRKLSAFVGIPGVIVFTAIVGGVPGAVRAAIFSALALSAPLFGRESDAPTSLGTALLLMLLVNPWSIGNIGLQLSFGATAGIGLFGQRLFRAMDGSRLVTRLRRTHRLLYRVCRYVLSAFATTLSALVFTTPMTAYWFGTVSLVSPLTNLLVLPLISVCFAPGLVAALIGSALGRGLGWLIGWPVRLILWIARVAAKLPYAQIGTLSPFVLFWLLFLYAALVLLWLGRPRKARPVMMICCAVLTLSVSLLYTSLEYTSGEFLITMLDVGQGQCIVLSGDGISAVVDCGGDYASKASELCTQYLRNAGEATLDFLILTHYDQDHAGGAPILLQQMPVQTLLLPMPVEESALHDEIVRTANETGTEITYVTQDLLMTAGNTALSVFAPVGVGSDNEAGLSVLFTGGSYDLLITGDMSIEQEKRLLLEKGIPELELLVAGHHGSKSSTGEALLAMTKPESVLISVGENAYGHPAGETLTRIEAYGAAIYRTDLNGTITVRR